MSKRIAFILVYWVFFSFFTYESDFCYGGSRQTNDSLAMEKIHLHFDKPFYTVGDTIWFKAYLVNSENQLTEHSKVLNVDLINESGSILESIKVPMLAGVGWADIPIDEGLPGGIYSIRAYTNWLRNFGDEYLFHKNIPVSDIFAVQIVGSIKYSYSDGQLVADLAFKNLDGTPIVGKDVKYSIPSKEKRILSGKGQTDANGHLRIRIDTANLGATGNLTAMFTVDTDTVFKSFSVPSNSSNFDVQFFPEGGDLINNIPSRVGFKVLGTEGLGLKASGYITDDSNQRITSFNTEFAGMGMFGFNPQSGRKYRAFVRLDNGEERSFLLPAAIDKGFVMTVSEDERNLFVKIRSNTEIAKGTPVTLQAMCKRGISVNSTYILADEHLVIKIAKNDLPAGVVRLSLLSDLGLPLAERLVFINPTAKLTISLSSLEDDYSLRSKVSPKIKTTDDRGKPVLAYLSMSVVEESKVPYDEVDELTILSNLLLTSELKGYVERPNYYFVEQDEDKKRQLDILMMTQGWRRFEWKDTNAENAYVAEVGLSVKGKIVSPLNAVSPNAKVNLLIHGQANALIDTVANEKGEFIFENVYFEGYSKLILSASNSKGNSNVNIKLDPGLEGPKVSPVNVPTHDLLPNLEKTMIENSDDGYLAYLKRNLNLTKTQQLSEVVVKAQRTRPPPTLNDSNGANSFLGNKNANAVTLTGALQSKVPGLMIMNNQPYRLRDLAMGVPIDVFLDGVPAGPDLNLFNMHMHTVSYVPRMLSTGRPGIVLGAAMPSLPSTPPLGLAVLWSRGYAPERQFYSPKYEPNAALLVEDHRSTIYWNPNILTINGENSDIAFYTAGNPGTYRFIIEGLDEYGRLGRTVLIKQIK